MHPLRVLLSITILQTVWGTCVEMKPKGVKELPNLDNHFEATVIVTYPAHRSSIEVTEYYDHDNKRGSLHFTKSGKKSMVLYDFNTHESFHIKGDVCTTGDIKKATFPYFIPMKDNADQIYQIVELIRDARKNDTVYVGTETIRGIETDHWSACMNENGQNFTVHFYFTQEGYMSAGVTGDPVPIKIQAGEPKNIIYDFALYRPGPITDSSVFEVPHGYVCTHEDESAHLMPANADAFTAHMEWIHPDTTYISNTFCAFDYKKRLSRHDLLPQKEGPTSQFNVFGLRPVSVIHDFNTGLEYLIDESQGNCLCRPINMTQPDLDDYSIEEHMLAMRHGYQLFHFANMDFHYQGHRVWRGVDCDVWSTLEVDYLDTGENYTMEAYFAQSQWNSTGGTNDPDFLGFWISSTKGENFETVRQVHVYDYTPTSPDPNLFNIRLCYNYFDEVIHAMFRLEGSYVDLVSRKSHVISPVVWDMIVEKCQVSHLRIADIYFDASSQENTDVWFTILNKPAIKGAKVENPVEQIDMGDAFKNLREAIKSGITIKVPYEDGEQEISVKKDSLMTNQQVFDPRIQPTHLTVRNTGHSNGAMAGLGIGMFFIGLIASVVIFVLWRRRNQRHHGSIPYTRDIEDF